jgi:hypothetical protein
VLLIEKAPGWREIKVFACADFFEEHNGIGNTPSGPMIKRSKSRVFSELGSQTCGSLLIGKRAKWGRGPLHLTLPLIVPPFSTATT